MVKDKFIVNNTGNKTLSNEEMLCQIYDIDRIYKYNYTLNENYSDFKYNNTTGYNPNKLTSHHHFMFQSKFKSEIRNSKFLKISYNNTEDFIKRENPKISLIVTVHNQEKFLKTFYASIQKQSLKDIEIILVDDASKDNSSMIIKEFMEVDKRIIYVKNKENKRAFYSRNRGVLFSRGEYVLAIDPDDLLLNDILIKAYNTSKKYNLDILQYYVMTGSLNSSRIWREVRYKTGILYGDRVMDVFYYCMTRNLWDKLIKREVFIESIKFMKIEFHLEKYVLHNDDTAFYGIIKKAKSYGFLEEVGYFYNFKNQNSTHCFYFEKKYMNNILHSLFATMKYYFIQSNNNTEKDLVAYNFFYKKVNKDYINRTQYLTEGFDYIIDVLDLYLDYKSYTINQINNLTNFKNKVIKRKEEIKISANSSNI